MRFSFAKTLVLALATTEVAVASNWFSKAAYNKWHETELERWLSDHNIPYPAPADRKDLENLVKNNWQSVIANPTYETVDQASDSFHSVKDWIFNNWTDSQLKSFLDKHGVPVPQPRKRDSLIAAARDNYESAAKKVGETSAYPGNWLYEAWSDSDLKNYLDERGYPAPQPSTRDSLIASVRRNSRTASLSIKNAAASASASAAGVQESLTDALFDAWSDSTLKEWLDSNGVKVPQGSNRNEMVALARKHRKNILNKGDEASGSAASAFGAATSSAGNQYAKVTDSAAATKDQAFDSVIGTWSDSRLKGYLDSRGVPVPQGGKRDEILASVRLNQHKAATGWSAWTFDTWTTDNLKKYLTSNNKKAVNNAKATRDDLVKQAQDSYYSASKSGGSNYASVTSYLSSATDSAKDSTFDTWSDSDLKAYLDSYGVPTYQGTKSNELKALAKKNSNYFRYGTSSPSSTLFAKLSSPFYWALDQLKLGAASGRAEGANAADSAASVAGSATDRYGKSASNSASSGSNVATNSAASATDRAGKSAASATDRAGKSAGSATDKAASSASSVASSASSAASSASKRAKNEL